MKMVRKMFVTVVAAIAMVFNATSAYALDMLPAEENAKAVSLINEYRAEHGLSALEWKDEMSSATVLRAQEISTSFSHTRPDGSAWYTACPDYFWEEMLADQFVSAEDTVTAWINHAPHRELMSNPNMKYINVSSCVGDNGVYYWACELGY